MMMKLPRSINNVEENDTSFVAVINLTSWNASMFIGGVEFKITDRKQQMNRFLIFQANRLFGGLPKHCHSRKRINYTWIRDLNPATLSTCYSVWKDSGHKKYHISITLESKSMSLFLPTLGNAVQDRVWINEGFFPAFSHRNCRLLAWAKFDSTRDLFEQILGPPTQVQQKFLSFNEFIQDVVAKMSRKFVWDLQILGSQRFSQMFYPKKKGHDSNVGHKELLSKNVRAINSKTLDLGWSDYLKHRHLCWLSPLGERKMIAYRLMFHTSENPSSKQRAGKDGITIARYNHFLKKKIKK